jgi:uncharacterized protein
MTNITHKEYLQILPGPAGDLETLWSVPNQSSNQSILGLICHPHPLYGGSMHHKVVFTVAKAFKSLNLISVRFNFRGVGASAGYYTNGSGEQEDVLFLLAQLKKQYPTKQVVLVGFSFGGFVAMEASAQWFVSKLILIAPPVERFNFTNQLNCPCTIVQGDWDEIVDAGAVFAWIKTFSVQPELIVIKGASHFFHGMLPQLKACFIDLLKPSTST